MGLALRIVHDQRHVRIKFDILAALMDLSFSAITTTVAVYRGKSSMMEYILAGTITGSMYKFNMGLRGMAAGAIFGGAFGTIAGAVTMLLLKSTGMTMEEARYWQYKWRSNRDNIVQDAIKVDIRGSEMDEPMYLEHDTKHGATNLDLKILDEREKVAQTVKQEVAAKPNK